MHCTRPHLCSHKPFTAGLDLVSHTHYAPYSTVRAACLGQGSERIRLDFPGSFIYEHTTLRYIPISLKKVGLQDTFAFRVDVIRRRYHCRGSGWGDSFRAQPQAAPYLLRMSVGGR
jgi:hypothetical protein